MSGTAFDIALQRKPEVFSPELLRALKIDSKAQARANGEIAGIDFDPFVGGQDPSDHYAVRQVTVKDSRCFAQVWRDSASDTTAKSAKPDVVAEMAQRVGHWEFVNFHYPDAKDDLLSALERWRKERVYR